MGQHHPPRTSEDHPSERLWRHLAHIASVFARQANAPRIDLDESEFRCPVAPPSGQFSVAIARTKPDVVVQLGPWRHDFAFDADHDDVPEQVADLVVAALVGDASIEVRRWSARTSCRLIVQRNDGRYRLPWIGPSPWLPWPRPAVEVLRNSWRRPSALKVERVVALPHAPWIGLGGFVSVCSSDASTTTAPDGVLDLHSFRPPQVNDVVLEFIDACHEHGVFELRLIHGKGIGHLRRTVHAALQRHPLVHSFRLGGHGEGSWGATLVQLHPERSGNTSPPGSTDSP